MKKKRMVILKEKNNCVQNKCTQTMGIGCVYEERLFQIKVSNKNKIILLFLYSHDAYVYRTLKVKG